MGTLDHSVLSGQLVLLVLTWGSRHLFLSIKSLSNRILISRRLFTHRSYGPPTADQSTPHRETSASRDHPAIRMVHWPCHPSLRRLSLRHVVHHLQLLLPMGSDQLSSRLPLRGRYLRHSGL